MKDRYNNTKGQCLVCKTYDDISDNLYWCNECDEFYSISFTVYLQQTLNILESEVNKLFKELYKLEKEGKIET